MAGMNRFDMGVDSGWVITGNEARIFGSNIIPLLAEEIVDNKGPVDMVE